MKTFPQSSSRFSGEATLEAGRWVLGEAGKDLLDDCQVDCLHLGPILVAGERGKVKPFKVI